MKQSHRGPLLKKPASRVRSRERGEWSQARNPLALRRRTSRRTDSPVLLSLLFAGVNHPIRPNLLPDWLLANTLEQAPRIFPPVGFSLSTLPVDLSSLNAYMVFQELDLNKRPTKYIPRPELAFTPEWVSAEVEIVTFIKKTKAEFLTRS